MSKDNALLTVYSLGMPPPQLPKPWHTTEYKSECPFFHFNIIPKEENYDQFSYKIISFVTLYIFPACWDGKTVSWILIRSRVNTEAGWEVHGHAPAFWDETRHRLQENPYRSWRHSEALPEKFSWLSDAPCICLLLSRVNWIQDIKSYPFFHGPSESQNKFKVIKQNMYLRIVQWTHKAALTLRVLNQGDVMLF